MFFFTKSIIEFLVAQRVGRKTSSTAVAEFTNYMDNVTLLDRTGDNELKTHVDANNYPEPILTVIIVLSLR